VEAAPSSKARADRSNGEPARVSPEFHHAVELIGRRWSGAIIWALAEHDHYFGELCQAIPGLSDRLLSRRLRELESEGLVSRSVHSGTPPRVSYALTDKGEALRPALDELEAWARRWSGGG
jgi:DNA-binding HxlR family transcriptional regulator